MITRVNKSSWAMEDNLVVANIVDHGALSDGVTDCHAAIIAALGTGFPIYIPPGTFLTSPVILTAGAVMFGEPGVSILKAVTNSATSLLTIGANTQLYNFNLDGNAANQIGANLHGVLASVASGSVIDGISVINTIGDGINIAGAGSNIDITNCSAAGFHKSGITVEAGLSITISNAYCANANAAAVPGNGISLAPISPAATLNGVQIIGGVCASNVGCGLAVSGNGGNNVLNVSVVGLSCQSNTSHGIYLLTCQQVMVANSVSKNNSGDGIRLENSTQYCRVTTNVTDTNLGFAIREVAATSTPNLNGLIYNVAVANSTNTITKLGAGSFIL